MRNQNCYETFKEAQRLRTRHPLGNGRYKLVECKDRLQLCHDEIDRIRCHLINSAPPVLRRCTVDDKHIWLKDLPGFVAHSLGYEVLPGLLALEGDGVSRVTISAAYPRIENECLTLLDLLESARIAIKKNIGVEYSHMRAGGSLLEPLVERAIDITSQALRKLP